MKNIVKTVLLSVILTAFTGTIAQDTIVCKGSGIIRPSKILPPASFLYRNLTESSPLDINVTYEGTIPANQIAALNLEENRNLFVFAHPTCCFPEVWGSGNEFQNGIR